MVNADVLTELTRLEQLVDDLLFLARTDERGPRPQHEDVDLDDLVAEEASRLRRTTGLQVVTQLVPTRVVGDRPQLARVLRNLADNAARHAVDRVELRVAPSAAAAVVDVEDDGPGIPVAERDRVFDRFVRLDASRERAAGGSGLGLAIAREIARAHGGDVVVLDAPRGAHLRLLVPQPADGESPDSGRVQASGRTLRS
jgi:signal transduction histidine kinase